MTIKDLVKQLKKYPQFAQIHEVQSITRDDGRELCMLILGMRQREDGTRGMEYQHISLGGY